MERKFLVLLRRFRLLNEHFHYIICGSLTLFISPVLTARRGASSPRSVVALNFVPPTEFGGNS